MSNLANSLVIWCAEIVKVNYDLKKCGLKEFNTTLGHIVLIGTLFSGCASLLLTSLYRPSAMVQLSTLLVPACVALLPLTFLLLLSIANLLYLAASFPPPPALRDGWRIALRVVAIIGTLMLVFGVMGVSIGLFAEALATRLAQAHTY